MGSVDEEHEQPTVRTRLSVSGWSATRRPATGSHSRPAGHSLGDCEELPYLRSDEARPGTACLTVEPVPGYISPAISVAIPRKLKNPVTSVTVVRTIEDDCAGS